MIRTSQNPYWKVLFDLIDAELTMLHGTQWNQREYIMGLKLPSNLKTKAPEKVTKENFYKRYQEWLQGIHEPRQKQLIRFLELFGLTKKHPTWDKIHDAWEFAKRHSPKYHRSEVVSSPHMPRSIEDSLQQAESWLFNVQEYDRQGQIKKANELFLTGSAFMYFSGFWDELNQMASSRIERAETLNDWAFTARCLMTVSITSLKRNDKNKLQDWIDRAYSAEKRSSGHPDVAAIARMMESRSLDPTNSREFERQLMLLRDASDILPYDSYYYLFCLSWAGEANRRVGRLNTARHYYNAIWAVANRGQVKFNDRNWQYVALAKLAYLDLDENKPDQALPELLKSVGQLPNREDVAELYIAIARAQFLQGNKEESLKYQSKGEQIALEIGLNFPISREHMALLSV